MKKTILMLAAIVFGLTTMAQFSYGPKVGLNLANFSGDDIEDNSMLIGFNAGLVGDIAFNEMFGLQAEVLYSAKGANIEGVNMDGEEDDIPYKVNYISVPLMARAEFGSGDMKFRGAVGPQIGFLMGATIDGESEFEIPTGFDINTGQITYETMDVKENYKSTDIGVAVGAGVTIPAGAMKLLVDARYTMGLSTIADSEGDEEADVKNGVIGIGVGLLFGGQ